MPLSTGVPFLQCLIVFVMIGVLGLVLRWTFGRGREASAPFPTTSSEPFAPPASPSAPEAPFGTPSSALPPAPAGSRAIGGASSRETPDTPESPNTPDTRAPDRITEDFGLLAAVAVVDSGAEAQRIQAVLRAAGIRATTAVGQDGRHRVLVFGSEVHRARRVGGWSA